MNRSEQINELAAALAKAQAEMKNPTFDAKNTFFKKADGTVSQYASLAAVRNAVIPVLSKHGLSLLQQAEFSLAGDRPMASVTTTLLHASGQWMESAPFQVPVAKPDAQGVCAGITYAKRCALQAFACVVGDDDDDGNHASGKESHEDKGASIPPPRKAATPQKPVPVPEPPPTRIDPLDIKLLEDMVKNAKNEQQLEYIFKVKRELLPEKQDRFNSEQQGFFDYMVKLCRDRKAALKVEKALDEPGT